MCRLRESAGESAIFKRTRSRFPKLSLMCTKRKRSFLLLSPDSAFPVSIKLALKFVQKPAKCIRLLQEGFRTLNQKEIRFLYGRALIIVSIGKNYN